ncbi:MAG: exodeoxyribonuclease III [Verrucomicrobia bacterium]|nr:exodeoxyribonuclease III [Verrucomicrobiota bacterium]
MKIVSWNVNGIRSCWDKGLGEWLKNCEAEIVCLQEIKCREEQWPKEAFGDTWEPVWNPAQKAGYSGTLTLTKSTPLTVTTGIGETEGDLEGRVITTEFPQCYVVNVYTPNARNDLSRLEYRIGTWDIAFREHCKRLNANKPVVFCGDLNVAHKEIDLANPRNNRRNAGFTDEERNSFELHLKAGFIDSFRLICDQPGQYSWWSYRSGARARNVGWRIDYCCISAELKPRLRDAWIEPAVKGSDHCPVGISLNFQ